MKRSATIKADLMSRLPVWTLALSLVMPQMALAQSTSDEEEAQVLGTIVLTATGKARALTDAPARITVISGEEIASNP